MGEKAAENGASGGCFWRPFHHALNVGLVALNSFYALAPKLFTVSNLLRAAAF